LCVFDLMYVVQGGKGILSAGDRGASEAVEAARLP
jgi:hypothetical protein